MIIVYSQAGERKLFAWGRGDYGQLGRDIRSDKANQMVVFIRAGSLWIRAYHSPLW